MSDKGIVVGLESRLEKAIEHNICLDNPKSGIATTTERNRKEDGHGQ